MNDWPPWKTRPENSHSGRILALAQCILSMHYHVEGRVSEGPIKTFNHQCSGDLERVARVLVQSGFTRSIDDTGTRSVFVSSPTTFEKIAQGDNLRRVSVKEVCEAVRGLAEGKWRSSEEIDYLAELAKQS